MKHFAINLAVFSLGAAIGTVVTWKYVSKRYEHSIHEEIQKFKEDYAASPIAHDVVLNKMDAVEADEYQKVEAEKIININKYTKYSDVEPKLVQPDDDGEEDDETSLYSQDEEDEEEPFIISPEEFGDNEDYDRIELTFYEGDGILANEKDEFLSLPDIDNLVGLDYKEHFGEYEDDSVFVRNDRLKCDIEVLKDIRKWADVVAPVKPKAKPKTTKVKIQAELAVKAKKPHQTED